MSDGYCLLPIGSFSDGSILSNCSTSPLVTSHDVVYPLHVWSDAAEALHHLPVVVLHPARGRHPQPHQAGQDQPAVSLWISRVCFNNKPLP